jgi:hypothetical protein
MSLQRTLREILAEIERAERRLEALAEDVPDVDTDDGPLSGRIGKVVNIIEAVADRIFDLAYDLNGTAR